MNENDIKLGLISSFVPKKCGIATYSRDLIAAMSNLVCLDWKLIAAEENNESYTYESDPLSVIKKEDQISYERAASSVNKWQPDVVLLEHEFGLFGGAWSNFIENGIEHCDPTGDYIFSLINNLKAPIITTFHTVIEKPDKKRLEVIKKIGNLSKKIVVMTNDSKHILVNDYEIMDNKIEVIPHGVPTPDSDSREVVLNRLGLKDNFYLLVTGLIGPNKGIDKIIKALPEIIKYHPQVRLLVVGQTHPEILKRDDESYRKSLIKLAKDLNVGDNVIFVNEYVSTPKLVDYLSIANIYLTIHSDPEQAASGTLAYALGTGLVTISTPYCYAKEVLADGRGIIIGFNDYKAITSEVNQLIDDKDYYQKIKTKAAAYGRKMTWPIVAGMYLKLLLKARKG